MARLAHSDDPELTTQRLWKRERWRFEESEEWTLGPSSEGSLMRELSLDEVLAAKLRRRMKETREGNLVWPTEDEIRNGKGDSD